MSTTVLNAKLNWHACELKRPANNTGGGVQVAPPLPLAKRAFLFLDTCLDVNVATTRCTSETLELPAALTYANPLSYGGVVGSHSTSFNGVRNHVCHTKG